VRINCGSSRRGRLLASFIERSLPTRLRHREAALAYGSYGAPDTLSRNGRPEDGGLRMEADDLLCSRNARPSFQKEVKVEAQVERGEVGGLRWEGRGNEEG
jgi:hypothetical protein